jgi:hypothetical protein
VHRKQHHKQAPVVSTLPISSSSIHQTPNGGDEVAATDSSSSGAAAAAAAAPPAANGEAPEPPGVFLHGIPRATKQEELQRLFEGFGPIASIEIVVSRTHDMSDSARIDFEAEAAAAKVRVCLARNARGPRMWAVCCGGCFVLVLLPCVPCAHTYTPDVMSCHIGACVSLHLTTGAGCVPC